jgi:1-acyl-sn-glycerol-3-phosphate acyltransferase
MNSAETLKDSSARARGATELPLMDRSKLRGFERLSVPLCDAVNTTFWLKRLMQLFVRYFTATWIYELARPLLVLDGLEPLRKLDPPKGIVLVSNHRSFFDMYVCCAVLYKHSSLLSRLHFPVRSNFWYTNPIGFVLNLTISACAMWPPVFRDSRRGALNPVGIEQIGYILGKKGSVLGFHPEGTRSKDPDPYKFLRPKKGIALILDRCEPETLVVPFFITGLSSSIGDQLGRWLRPKKGENDIRLRFGAPVPAGDFQNNQSPGEVAESVMDLVRSLGEQDRLEHGS